LGLCPLQSMFPHDNPTLQPVVSVALLLTVTLCRAEKPTLQKGIG
jgi:hypothetical protein